MQMTKHKRKIRATRWDEVFDFEFTIFDEEDQAYLELDISSVNASGLNCGDDDWTLTYIPEKAILRLKEVIDEWYRDREQS